MVAKGLQTKQVGHRLGISAKSADRHLQNAYAKMGVSTRAAAALLPCSTASPPGENSRYRIWASVPSVEPQTHRSRAGAETRRPSWQSTLRHEEPRARRNPPWVRITCSGLGGHRRPGPLHRAFLAQDALRRDEFSPVAEPVSALEVGPNGFPAARRRCRHHLRPGRSHRRGNDLLPREPGGTHRPVTAHAARPVVARHGALHASAQAWSSSLSP